MFYYVLLCFIKYIYYLVYEQMNQDTFRNKYLKYKLKYLELKELYGNGFEHKQIPSKNATASDEEIKTQTRIIHLILIFIFFCVYYDKDNINTNTDNLGLPGGLEDVDDTFICVVRNIINNVGFKLSDDKLMNFIGLKSNDLDIHFSSKPAKEDRSVQYHYSKRRSVSEKKCIKCDHLSDSNLIINDIVQLKEETSINKYTLLLIGAFASTNTQYREILKMAIKFLYWIYPKSNKVRQLFDNDIFNNENEWDSLPNPNLLGPETTDKNNIILNSFLNQLTGKGRTSIYALLWTSKGDDTIIKQNIDRGNEDSVYREFIDQYRNQINEINSIGLINLSQLSTDKYIQELKTNKILIDSCGQVVDQSELKIDKNQLFANNFSYFADIEQKFEEMQRTSDSDKQKINILAKKILDLGFKTFILDNMGETGIISFSAFDKNVFLQNVVADKKLAVHSAKLNNDIKKITLSPNTTYSEKIKELFSALNDKLNGKKGK
jgi:hypothetical protein